MPDRRRLLLGGSRVDVAALVVVKAIADHLRPDGIAAFFLPLSLLTGDGAHAGFRRYGTAGVPFAVRRSFDFAGMPLFPGVATRYGTVLFQRDVAAALADSVGQVDVDDHASPLRSMVPTARWRSPIRRTILID